jgi:hypothetical protein
MNGRRKQQDGAGAVEEADAIGPFGCASRHILEKES